MKKSAIALAALALAFLFSTCAPKTTTIDECISNFMSDINSIDRSNVYTNLDSSSTAYSLAKAASYWDSQFPTADIPYSLSGQSTVGSVVSATVNTANLVWGGQTIYFVMSEDGNVIKMR
jgi:hypothetical protein